MSIFGNATHTNYLPKFVIKTDYKSFVAAIFHQNKSRLSI